MCSEESQERKN
jgi:hypothetical protein